MVPKQEKATVLNKSDIYIIESVEDEDEVLTALSEELGKFVEYVGGPEYGHVLLSPLENLAAIEEPLVREKVCACRYCMIFCYGQALTDCVGC